MEQLAQVHILHVEDDEIDIMALDRAFKQHRIANPIVVARDGEEALALLRGRGNAPPYIVLLDLNMPRMGGLEFLEAIRNDPTLKPTVVFVMTTSTADEDRVASYNYNVAGYVAKSDIGEGFLELVKLLQAYWKVVTLPSRTPVGSP